MSTYSSKLFSPGDGVEFSSFSVWVGLRDWLANNRVWKGKNSNFTVENLADPTLTKWSRLTSPVRSYVDITYPSLGCVEKGTSPQICHLSVIMRKQTNSN